MEKRQPIVVVLGHVDHGKTTLLDALRKTSVASREAGGITQGIGASVVNEITFIDTPGHAAFSKMRGRGAKTADIALLIVAQDDGVKPQTLEAIKIIKDANLPFIVVGTKNDVAGTNPDSTKAELEKHEIYFEGRGGDTPFVSISARNGDGLKELIEMIKLVAEVNDFKADKNGNLEATIIESVKGKMGPTASLVVRNGSIKVGQTIFAEDVECKVKAIFDYEGKSIKEVSPGFPAQVIGFNDVPQVGASVKRESHEVVKEVLAPKNKFDLRRLKDDEIPLILKASNAGALEAIIASLPPKIVVVDSGVGEITSSDIINAKTGNAFVFSFETKIPQDVIKLAEAEKIIIKKFDIIYELLQEIDEILKSGKLVELGRAQILASFPFDNKKVAGSKMISGKFTKGDKLTLVRAEKEIGKAKITSLRKGKSEVSGVAQGEEFGVIIDPQLDFNVGDVLVSLR